MMKSDRSCANKSGQIYLLTTQACLFDGVVPQGHAAFCWDLPPFAQIVSSAFRDSGSEPIFSAVLRSKMAPLAPHPRAARPSVRPSGPLGNGDRIPQPEIDVRLRWKRGRFATRQHHIARASRTPRRCSDARAFTAARDRPDRSADNRSRADLGRILAGGRLAVS
jgi:hypothetical protein